MQNVSAYCRLGALLAIAAAWPMAARAQSAAAVANVPANRGKVIGARCHPGDGYLPDWTKLEIKVKAAEAAQTVKRPINVMDYATPDTPAPVGPAHLPSGQVYCLSTPEYPEGYLTSNCTTDADCPSPATCDGTLCRAACSADLDCPPPMACPKMSAKLNWCRHVVGAEEEKQEVPSVDKGAKSRPTRVANGKRHRKNK
jgi:hypothetical protein